MMDSDLKSVNATQLTKKQDDDQPKDLKLKQKVEDVDNQPKDLKMKQKIEDHHPPYPQKANQVVFKIPKVEGIQIHPKGRERDEAGAESSKRSRIEKSAEVIDVSSDLLLKLMELVEEVVRIYSEYIDHIYLMAKERFKDEQRLNFDQELCSSLAETVSQKIERLESELERMKKDSSQRKNYLLVEPRVRQITKELINMHERFDRSPNISASSKTKCSKEELLLCMDEINQLNKELYGIISRIGELKTMKMYKKTMEVKQRNLRI